MSAEHDAAHTPSRGDVIRRSIMMSMALTGERYLTAEGAALYSHDDYDAAHAALNELLAENKRLREALAQISARLDRMKELTRDA